MIISRTSVVFGSGTPRLCLLILVCAVEPTTSERRYYPRAAWIAVNAIV